MSDGTSSSVRGPRAAGTSGPAAASRTGRGAGGSRRRRCRRSRRRRGGRSAARPPARGVSRAWTCTSSASSYQATPASHANVQWPAIAAIGAGGSSNRKATPGTSDPPTTSWVEQCGRPRAATATAGGARGARPPAGWRRSAASRGRTRRGGAPAGSRRRSGRPAAPARGGRWARRTAPTGLTAPRRSLPGSGVVEHPLHHDDVEPAARTSGRPRARRRRSRSRSARWRAIEASFPPTMRAMTEWKPWAAQCRRARQQQPAHALALVGGVDVDGVLDRGPVGRPVAVGRQRAEPDHAPVGPRRRRTAWAPERGRRATAPGRRGCGAPGRR